MRSLLDCKRSCSSSLPVRTSARWLPVTEGVGPRAWSAVLAAIMLLALSGFFSPAAAGETVIRYFPVGQIYEYRWKLLELALSHAREDGDDPVRLVPLADDVTQNRGMQMLQAGMLDVIALGTTEEREMQMLPIRIDILRGIVGFRVFVIRAADQERIAAMDEQTLRKELTFGLNSQWADLAILQANGYAVVTSPNYENLFDMLAAGRFDAFTRGLNEADREVAARSSKFPQLAVEQTMALYFSYPVYFWVRKENVGLAQRIERGLELALADGSFRNLFESYHAQEIKKLAREKRRVIRLDSPILPKSASATDTSWWWR